MMLDWWISWSITSIDLLWLVRSTDVMCPLCPFMCIFKFQLILIDFCIVVLFARAFTASIWLSSFNQWRSLAHTARRTLGKYVILWCVIFQWFVRKTRKSNVYSGTIQACESSNACYARHYDLLTDACTIEMGPRNCAWTSVQEYVVRTRKGRGQNPRDALPVNISRLRHWLQCKLRCYSLHNAVCNAFCTNLSTLWRKQINQLERSHSSKLVELGTYRFCRSRGLLQYWTV